MGCCEAREVIAIQRKTRQSKQDTECTSILVKEAESLKITSYQDLKNPKVDNILHQIIVLEMKQD